MRLTIIVTAILLTALASMDAFLYYMAFSTMALWPGIPIFVLAAFLTIIIIVIAVLLVGLNIARLILNKLED